jgi:cyclic lactone autoinducer peptide
MSFIFDFLVSIFEWVAKSGVTTNSIWLFHEPQIPASKSVVTEDESTSQ